MKILRYILILSVLAPIGACSDYLDRMPDDQLTLEMVFNDKTRTEDWLAGIYTNIPDPYWGHTRHIGFDALSDEIVPSPRWEQWGWDVISKQTGNWNTASGWDANYWSELPKRIRSAYIFIDNVKPNAAQKVTEEDVENMKNEARFLIAYYYSLMVQTYGAVPFTLGLTASNASEEELFIGQTPFDQIIDWLDTELYELSTLLPHTYSDNQKFGRATGIMCLAVRARILLFAASPLTNGNPDYAGHVNNKGEELFNTTYDPGKWQRAALASKELIDAAEQAGHELYYEYNDAGSIDPFLSYQNMMFKRTSDGNNLSSILKNG